MKPKRYIVWSRDKIDLRDPWQKKWYIKQVLINGRAEDIALLNWEEIKCLLRELELPLYIKNLWEDYFNVQR